MKIFVQEMFGSPTKVSSLRDEPLVIHRRSDSPVNRHLAIFVHGLGGTRYGKKSTWGLLPNYLSEDFPQLDIGMYSFRSAWRRLKFWRSIPVPREAEVLADVLRSLRRDQEYAGFILIGHSLGGLLCKGAAAVLSEKKQRQALQTVSDLLLMATPQLGSLRVPGILQWATADAKVLRAHSDFILRVMNVFQARFHCLIEPPTDARHHLRAWSVIAAADVWVDALSAGIGIDESQRLTVAGSHTEVVKPTDKNSEAYRFVHDCVRIALQPKPTAFRSETYRAVRFDELSDLHDFAATFFPEPISDLSLMREWWGANAEVFQLIERITKVQGRVHTETAGYFCVLPISSEVADQLKSGKIAVTDLTQEHILAPGQGVRAAYIGGIGGVDKVSQGSALNFLQAHLRYLASGSPLRLLTRPVTEEGLALVNGYSFQPTKVVNGSALGVVHENTLAGFNKMMRNAHRRRRTSKKSASQALR